MNKITTNTIAFWFNLLFANLWLIEKELLLTLAFFIGAGVAMWNEYNTKDTK